MQSGWFGEVKQQKCVLLAVTRVFTRHTEARHRSGTSQYFIRNYSSAIVHCSGVLAPVVCA